MVKAYNKFAAHLSIIKSKFETAVIHSNNKSQWQHHFHLVHNPTMLIYVKGKLIISRHWSKRLNHALKIMQKKVMQDREDLMVQVIDTDQDMESIIKKHPRAIIYIGDDQKHQNYFEFLELSYRKKHYEFLYIRVKNSKKYIQNSLYLYQGWNQTLKQIEVFPNLLKTIDWLYHHSDHSVLEFPQPAINQIIEHRNMGFVLVFQNSSDLKQKKYQDVYEQFELASQEIYQTFKFTTCFLDQVQCKKLITEDLKGSLDGQYPRIILIIPTSDFRSDFVGIRFNKQITKDNIIDFSNNFFDQDDMQLELVSENFSQKEFDMGKLIGKNLFESVKNYPEHDRIVFYYRGGLKKDIKIFEEYKKITNYLKQNVDEDIKFYFYDIEKNFIPKIFENDVKSLPGLQLFKQKLDKKHAKVQKDIKNLIQIKMFLNDHLTNDYSKLFIQY